MDDKDTLNLIQQYFDTKIDGLKEYFDEKFKNMEKSTNSDIAEINDKLEKHDTRITELEKVEGRKAINLINQIKENAIKFAVPTLIILIAFLLGSGYLQRLVGLIK